jgi:hypothetical protein
LVQILTCLGGSLQNRCHTVPHRFLRWMWILTRLGGSLKRDVILITPVFNIELLFTMQVIGTNTS